MPLPSGVPRVPLPGDPTAPPLSGPNYGDIPGQIRGIIDPQLQAAADAINRRSIMGSTAISGLSRSLQGMLSGAGADVGAAYGPEIGYAQGTAQVMKQGLVGSGQAKAADLGAALKQSGVAGPGDINLAGQGAGAGAAAYGTGIAELDRLIANQAASQARAALEPSFAAGMGAQDQSMLAAQLARSLADQQSSIMAQIPGLTLDLTRDARSAFESDRAFKAAQAQDERDYAEKVREYDQEQARLEAQRKAGIVGRSAPTAAGREAYWQSVADQRTKNDPQGRQWIATPNGINFVRTRPGGPPARTAAWVNQQAGQIISTGIDPNTGMLTAAAQKKLDALHVATGGGVSKMPTSRTQVVGSDKSGRKLVDLNTGQVITTLTTPITTKPKPGKPTYKQDKQGNWWSINNAGRATKVQGMPPGKVAAAKADAPLGAPTGNRPRRSKAGTWTYATGKPVEPRVAAVWERRYQGGLTDGRGGLGPANSDSTTLLTPPTRAGTRPTTGKRKKKTAAQAFGG